LLAELFSDQSVLQAMLDFEVALAAPKRVEDHPQTAAEAMPQRHEQKLSMGFPCRGRSARWHSGRSAGEVSNKECTRTRSGCGRVRTLGATSQDVTDTALILLLKKAQRFWI